MKITKYALTLAVFLSILISSIIYISRPEWILERDLIIAYHHDIRKVIRAAASRDKYFGIGAYGSLENRIIKSGWGSEKAERIVNSGLLSDPDADVRSMAVFALGATKTTDGKYIPMIIKNFSDPYIIEPEDALRYFKDQALPYLESSLKSNCSLVRARACRGLSFVSKSKAYPLLMKVLQVDTDKDVLREASYSLCEISSPDAISFMLLKIKSEQNREIQKSYISSFKRLNHARTIQAFVEIMEDPNIPNESKIHCSPVYSGKLPQNIVAELQCLKKSKDKDISKWAENMLNQCGYE